MKRLIKNTIVKNIAGKKKYQSFFESLFHLSILGMNYGRGDFLETSGEVWVMSYIKNKLPQDESLTLFDIGGNIGVYTMELLNSFVDRNILIHTFEPSKKTFQVLTQNVTNTEKVVLNNFGISNKVGKLNLYSDQECSGMSSLYQRDLDFINRKMDIVEEVDLSTIDSYCWQKNIDCIHFLKIDIEGHELQAFDGAKKMLNEKRIKFIQFEFGGTNIDSKTYFKDFWNLLNRDYNFYRIVSDGIQPITTYMETYEIFTTVNFLLELK